MSADLDLETSTSDVILRIRGIEVSFGTKHILKGLDLDVYAGEILGFVGGSGSGKSVLLRAVLGLVPKQAGTIHIFGQDYDRASDKLRLRIDQKMGVLFQHGALFSSLTVKENIQVPMREYLELSPKLRNELAEVKIELVGLPADAADKYPSELSGGMIKRAGLARALSLDPDLLFVDEPTSGLDPIGAAEFDELIRSLSNTLGLTTYMVTHDLDSLYSVCDRVAVLRDGKVLVAAPLDEVVAVEDPWIAEYFRGKRSRAAGTAHKGQQKFASQGAT
ncbi:MAG: ABC transporter ATP-binding protein [Ahrensia sp.]|nr:ABC transporter ATP-binding protein [Ahrensia sp.]